MTSVETRLPAGRAPAATAPPRRRGPSPMRRRENAAAYILITPFVVVFALLIVVPIIYSGYLSLYREQLVGGNTFVGLENYSRALSDSSFLSGVGRMAVFLVIQVPIMLGLALLFALLLDAGVLYLGKFIRLGIFIPYAVPSVIAALMWGYLYGTDFGPAAQIAERLGISAPPFLSQDWMLFSIMNIVTWSFIGYNMIILYAALRSIPSELFDAAAVDGAGRIRTAVSIKIPAIRPALILTAIFSVIGTFQLFTEPNLLRSLAPNVIGTDYTPNMYAYNLAFINRDSNYAAAIAFILGVVIMIVSYTVQLSTQRKERAAR
ncbi:carbohydrate ABC transporter permease [Pengzhenrongella sicca]|uniref:Sugar ABC transporter permease n=1 Tax=Pengzhenrongella sicca TaxID=2819238 RepID=A0A8A4ZJP3_9MICO|nr:sugar ABC transporter permease [Pengzhenrongella sicca]QTE31189.1 sugar ABC transporter permease [Pengzhenrongella sicca]